MIGAALKEGAFASHLEEIFSSCFEASRVGIVNCDIALTEFSDSLSARDKLYALACVRRKLAVQEIDELLGEVINYFIRAVCSAQYSWEELHSSITDLIEQHLHLWRELLPQIAEKAANSDWVVRAIEFYEHLVCSKRLLEDESFLNSLQGALESMSSLHFINEFYGPDIAIKDLPVFGIDFSQTIFGSHKFGASVIVLLFANYILENKLVALKLKVQPGSFLNKKVLISPVYVRKLGLRSVRLNYLNCSRLIYPVSVPQSEAAMFDKLVSLGGPLISRSPSPSDQPDDADVPIFYCPHSGSSDISQFDNAFLKKIVGEYRKSSVYPQTTLTYVAQKLEIDAAGFTEKIGLIFEIMVFDLFLHSNSSMSGDGSSNIHIIHISEKMVSAAKHLFYCLSLTQLYELKKIIKKFPLLDEYIRSLSGNLSFSDSDGSRRYLSLLKEVLDLGTLPKLFEKVKYVIYPSEDKIDEIKEICKDRDAFVYYVPFAAGAVTEKNVPSVGVLGGIVCDQDNVLGGNLIILRYSADTAREKLLQFSKNGAVSDLLEVSAENYGPGIGINFVPIRNKAANKGEKFRNARSWIMVL